MPGGLRFRHRIGLLVALAALGLVTVTAVTLVLGRRAERQMGAIENRYVPLIELDRDLKTLLTQTTHALEDAAAAAEDSQLAEADRYAAELARRITSGADAIRDNGGDPAALHTALAAYYTAAREVAVGMIGGTPAAQLERRIEDMRRALAALTAALDAAATPDRSRLADAFGTARSSEREALWTDIAIASGVLVLMALVSWRIIRRTARSLQAVSSGIERLARGDFETEIEVTSRDEFGELAREGNQTAERLRDYRQRSDALVRETQRQADEIARASRHKSEFLANMSHELRTPLNSILILSKVLGENDGGRLTDKQVEFATLIHRSGEELLALINEVLDLAKIEAGRQEIAVGTVVVADIADYARKMFAHVAAQKQLAYRVDAAADLPAEIQTDWARLAQILKNLLSNAFKFTERGEVAVRIARAPASGDAISISVSDTGIGIAPDAQAWIFEAFAQAEGGTSRKYGGTGLGLTIAKQLAMRLGGDLRLDSAVGAGSTFHLVLPVAGPAAEGAVIRVETPRPVTAPLLVLEPAPAAPARRESSRAIDPGLVGKTVLIVDDDMRNLYSLSSSLRARHLQVLTAADGQEALDELALHPEISAVLMDLMMPGMDGHEATRRIRALPAGASLPIIVITASAADGERERALAAGADDFLGKPIDVERLIAALERLISSPRRREPNAGS